MTDTITKRDAVDAALQVAEDIGAGKLSPAELESQVVSECRELFGTVIGDVDPLWPLHRDVTRQSIALGALTADELAEWSAVIRRREGVASGAVKSTDGLSPAGVDGWSAGTGFVRLRAAQRRNRAHRR